MKRYYEGIMEKSMKSMKRAVIAAVMAVTAAGFGWGQQQAVVAVAPFEAKSGISIADANTITEIYSVRLAAARAVRVVTRDALDKVVREHGFQAGDWSDDRKTAALGKALNADWVVRGTLQKLESFYIVTATLLDIKSLEIMGGADMRLNRISDAYDNMGDFIAQTVQTVTGRGGAAAPAAGAPRAAAREYKVGDYGPGGGWVFYDKGRVVNGWRYLEAAPSETEFANIEWGASGKTVGGTETRIGSGKRNTEVIVAYLQRIGENGKAAQLCDSLEIDGYDDWFLPSQDELNLMYVNLKKKGLGEFSNEWYWSSSEASPHYSWKQYFGDGSQDNRYKSVSGMVRAVRAF